MSTASIPQFGGSHRLWDVCPLRTLHQQDLIAGNTWRQFLRVAGRESDFTRPSGNSLDLPEFPRNCPEVRWRRSRKPLTADLKSNLEVPEKFARLPQKFPTEKFQWKSAEVCRVAARIRNIWIYSRVSHIQGPLCPSQGWSNLAIGPQNWALARSALSVEEEATTPPSSSLACQQASAAPCPWAAWRKHNHTKRFPN